MRTSLILMVTVGLFATAYSASIPVAGNAWIVNPSRGNGDFISHNGQMKWENKESIFRTYFKVEQAGKVDISIRVKADRGPAMLEFATGGGLPRKVLIKNPEFETISVGSFQLKKAGYNFLEMRGVDKKVGSFAHISDVIIESSVGQNIQYAKDDFYWSRRGPSVHLNYQIPARSGDILYFYNEITVPRDSDPPGSYYMANGFNVGYFGIQVKSPTERWVLFSVWSPHSTDNPNEIPEEKRVLLLKSGPDVHAGKFGGEGSGGQSYRIYPWKTGATHRFLLKGEPTEDGSTDFTAWFQASDMKDWELMASFRRPQTTTYLKNLHSFLENFATDTGYLSRSALYSNQWIFTADGKWHELTDVNFSADGTAHKKNRLDYAGGSDGKQFILKNCGFFDSDVAIGSRFSRNPNRRAPSIDFSKLP